MPETIAVVDAALLALNNDNCYESLENLAVAMRDHLALDGGSEPFEALFDPHLSRTGKQFVGTCLWRALAAKPFDRAEEVRVIDTIEEVYGVNSAKPSEVSDTYRELRIQLKQQNYEKRAALIDGLTRLENDFRSIAASVTSLDQLSKWRQQFMKRLNAPLARALVTPFLPPQAVERTALDGLFSQIQSYVDAPPYDVLRVYSQTQAVLDDFRKTAADHDTYYARSFIVPIAERLKQAVRDHFDASAASKPARILLSGSAKKYPFHVADTVVLIGIIIENDGPGFAFDTYLAVESTDVEFHRQQHYIGQVQPGAQLVEIPATVREIHGTVSLGAKLCWRNFDDSEGATDQCLQFAGQRSDIDWDALRKADPYHLQPVEDERELVGRKETLDELVAQTRASSIGSSYLYGQKRVGKTSIAKTLKNRLRHEAPEITVIYVEAGDFVHPSAATTATTLGRRLCNDLRKAHPRLGVLPVPEFGDALTPITDFLDAAAELVPELRVLFVIDEFDELPLALYNRTVEGNPFFLTLRSISGKPQFGFILVGGEKMEPILSTHGQHLNKFTRIRVDYFDKEQHRTDFRDLVCKPVERWLEITDEALETLWQYSAGHPYYTRLICRSLFKAMVGRRDGHITPREVLDAVHNALDVAANAFQHFWEDGIFTSGPEAEEVSLSRRKVLLSIGELLRTGASCTKEGIAKAAAHYGLVSDIVEHELRELERRKILVSDGDTFVFKVGFFGRWLRERGLREIMTTFVDPNATLARRAEDERAYVTSNEVVEIATRWGTYQGRPLTEDHVRRWLQQFGKNTHQRLMFRLLDRLKFYPDRLLREKMSEAHGIVTRGMLWTVDERKRKRADILVSYLDGPGKSGAHYGRLYADENSIYAENVVERGRLKKLLTAEHPYQALVFLDDFVGTGNSVREYFTTLAPDLHAARAFKPLRIFFIAVSGFADAKRSIEERLAELSLEDVVVRICDPLDETACCFNERSRVFTSTAERDAALRLAIDHGSRLVNDAPLGYGNCQATVVFESSCPNNSLPILWAESNSWTPLFKRIY